MLDASRFSKRRSGGKRPQRPEPLDDLEDQAQGTVLGHDSSVYDALDEHSSAGGRQQLGADEDYEAAVEIVSAAFAAVSSGSRHLDHMLSRRAFDSRGRLSRSRDQSFADTGGHQGYAGLRLGSSK